MNEKTLSILKPDVIKRNIIGKVISYIEQSGLKIITQKKMLLTKKQAELFYEVHKERPFFPDLVEFMTSGSVIVQALSGENAVSKYRTIMGATDPKQADKGTIRGDLADNIDANCVHGSDSIENAKKEIAFFFAEYELIDTE
ncbi:MAG: nucleoside diphosphate kinase [Candidatus Mesenet longicola]|uniref:Nucleoside diphosphate kinase n=1 Tax=Candidatus Mesenet longicola TaxID=1892558 RepID=A0A8J3HWF1_9RICK|nr:MAG: nucleoside diphosphate kinase [Candidatus Mesenet longicola]GHM59531.1 MAG: nucleoside diphosphate kinase [Candidatus Mesenet longicola]